ncbi:phosphatidylglycerophosphatase A [Paenibacillus sp. JCM 10914]|uniref:phosphatidylglycerophosphatase A family protein n=1 Tax=Paenibacillus sp. JCM 10914 TaxID=1236974 RepID=UPI0003CC96FF|nr:phosphatidylglycerophosphatase A [Paenibacillus sp. JCM 10914]GAE05874.1 low temperature requirement C protein [Paenibacillus sp. JCM 10914]
MSSDLAENMLSRRGVSVSSIADIVFRLQQRYHPKLTMDQCEESVRAVLGKREVQYTLFTGIALDELAEKKLLPQPLQSIMEQDEPLYGVDETMALGVTSIYGMIGLTSFGYLDKEKIGIIDTLNEQKDGIHVFLDDLVAGIAAAASSRIAHRNPDAAHYAADSEGKA